MSRGSDIDFAKFCLIFGFAKKDDICSAIREVALLQELGINKRLPHVMYERGFLSTDQVQAIFWGLYNSKRIRRYPTRIVYEFSEEDDLAFFARASIPINDLIDGIRKHTNNDHSFPQEFLIYCQDIQSKLNKKGFPRTLLSILNTKGYLSKPYKNLVPNIENKRVILSSPRQIKEPAFQQKCEQILFAALAKKKFNLKAEEAEHSLSVWQKVIKKYDIDFKYSEILFFLGYAKRTEVHSVGMILEYVTGINQNPRVKFIDSRARLFSIQHPEFKEKYAKEYDIAENLRAAGLVKLDGSNILLYKNIIDYDDLPNDQSTASFDLAIVSGDKSLLTNKKLLAAGAQSERDRRKKLFRTMFPFSLKELGHEFEQLYLQERLAIRKGPKEPAQIVQEWAQTQILSLQDDTYQTEVVPLPGRPGTEKIIAQPRRKVTRNIDNTDYISLPDQEDNVQAGVLVAQGSQTEYFSLNDATQELKVLSDKIQEKVAEVRYTKMLFWSIFCLYAGAAVLLSEFDVIFGKTSALPLYSGLSTFIMCFPAIIWGTYFGKLADQGHCHKLIFWGFIIHLVCIPILPFCNDIYLHLGVKFVQAIGLVAAGVATEFCVSRWYGIGERGKMLGVAAMVSSVAAAIGFVFPSFFKGFTFPYVPDQLAPVFIASLVWMFITILTLPFAYRLRLSAVNSEDIEEDLPSQKLAVSRVPLLASAIYGIIQMGMFIVFIPTFEEKLGDRSSKYFTEEYVASILAIGALMSSYAFGRISDRIGPLRILRTLTLLAVCCCTLIPYMVSLDYILLIFFVLGLVEGGLHPLGFGWLLESIDDEQYFGAATGAYTLYNSAGAMFGCLFCGFIFSNVTIQQFFLVMTIIFIFYFYLLLISPSREGAVETKPRVRGVLKFLEPPETEL